MYHQCLASPMLIAVDLQDYVLSSIFVDHIEMQKCASVLVHQIVQLILRYPLSQVGGVPSNVAQPNLQGMLIDKMNFPIA